MADKYHSFSLTAVSRVQYDALLPFLQAVSGAQVSLIEYSPSQVLSVSGGGRNLTAWITAMRAVSTARLGRAWTTDASATRGTKVETGTDRR